jgi:hypothetical protein
MQTLCKKQPGGGTTKTQYWKAKGPDTMEIDNSTSSKAKEELLEGSPCKKLTDEERAALKLLGLCYFCRGGKHLSANCPEKPPQQNQGQDRRALPGKLLRSAVTTPIKNFFSSSLAPTRSLHHQLTSTSLNCTIPNYPPSPASTCTSLNCNLALTPHDMPSGLAGSLGHLRTHPDDMPSGHPDLTDTLGYRPEDMPSGPPDIHLELIGHLGYLGYLSLLGHLGYLNILDLEPIDIPLHAFIEEEGST